MCRRPPSHPELALLLVADLLHPVDHLAVEFLLDGDVRHRAVWRGAVPMLLSWRTGDHIPGMNLFDGSSPASHEAAAALIVSRLTCGWVWRGTPAPGSHVALHPSTAA